jgi:hypothetical protein
MIYSGMGLMYLAVVFSSTQNSQARLFSKISCSLEREAKRLKMAQTSKRMYRLISDHLSGLHLGFGMVDGMEVT